MDLIKYVSENALVLIPVLYIIGSIAKGTEKVNNKWIPVVLLPVGVLGAIALLGLNANAVLQGILVTGVTVYADQLVKQIKE